MTNPFTYSHDTSRNYSLHAFLFLFAICVRVFFLIWIDEPILFVKYPLFAEKIANGMDIGERLVDLSPFYLYFLAVFKKLFGVGWPFVKGFQIIIGATNTLLVFAIGARLFDRRAAFIGAIIFAAYGNLIVFETTLEPTVFVFLFNLLSVYFLILFNTDSHSPTKKIWIILAAGICSGIGVITKPNFLLFLPAAIVWILFCRKADPGLRQRVLHGILFLVAAFLVIALVTVRNYLKFNDSILVTADAGKVFFHGNSKTATAVVGADLQDDSRYESNGREPDYAHVLFRQTASKISGRPLTPSESSSFWVKITLNDIRDDPLLYLKRCFQKAVHFFTDYELHYIASAYKEYKESLSYPFFRYGMIVSLGFLGIGLSIRNLRELLLIYETMGIYLVSCTLFLVNARYRIPAVPYFCLFAGYAIHRLTDMIKAQQFKQAGISLLILTAVYLSTHLAFSGALGIHDQWQEATKIHYEMDARSAFNAGRYRAAVISLSKCITILPRFHPAYILRGKSHAMLGELEKAEADFIQAIRLNPEDPRGHKNLGFLYLLQGKTDRAEISLKRALKRDPQDKKILEALKTLSEQKKRTKIRLHPDPLLMPRNEGNANYW